jgi:hypothetical protein
MRIDDFPAKIQTEHPSNNSWETYRYAHKLGRNIRIHGSPVVILSNVVTKENGDKIYTFTYSYS